MEFREYWTIARKRGWIIVLVAVVAAIAALGVSLIMPKTYKATIQLSVNPARADWGLSQATKELLRNFVLNIKSHRMTQKAIDEAQLDLTTDQFLANLFVQERVQWNQEQDKADRIDVTKVDDIRYVPLASPNRKFNTLAGAVFGVIAGGIIVFFLEWLQSDILRTAADVEKAMGVPVLGAIPAGGQAKAGRSWKWHLPAWIEPGVLLFFFVGLVIGAALGALIVALL